MFRVHSHHYVNFYRPQTKLRKGNVFTPVCQSLCSQGRVSQHALRQTTPCRHPLHSACWDTPSPAQCMLGYTLPCPVHAGIHPPLPSACWDTPSPAQCMLGYTPHPAATAADGTHSTGLHTCQSIQSQQMYHTYITCYWTFQSMQKLIKHQVRMRVFSTIQPI